MSEDFDYRAELAEIDEYCSYLEQTLEEEINASWVLLERNKYYATFINMLDDIRIVMAKNINKIFKEK